MVFSLPVVYYVFVRSKVLKDQFPFVVFSIHFTSCIYLLLCKTLVKFILAFSIYYLLFICFVLFCCVCVCVCERERERERMRERDRERE